MLYTTLPHNLIKYQLVDLIKNTFRREGVLYLACNEERAVSLQNNITINSLWTCRKVQETLVYLLDTIYSRFGSKFYRQNVGIPMGANCTPLLLICFYFAMRGRLHEVSHKGKTV